MEDKNIHDDLAAIRSLMERSQKFISLSGLSGILAGIYALIGAAAAYYLIYHSGLVDQVDYAGRDITLAGYWSLIVMLLFVAFAVLAASLVTGLILAQRKAKRKAQPIWGEASKQLL